LPRVKQKTLGKEAFAESQIKNSRQRKNTRQRGFFAESQPENSRQRKNTQHSSRQRIYLPSAIFFLSGKKFLKITFLPPNFFYLQHTLIKNLCSKLA
jgi:hypothetical protein